MSQTGECRQQKHTQHAPSAECDKAYINGWIKKKTQKTKKQKQKQKQNKTKQQQQKNPHKQSHTQKISPKMVTPRNIAWERRRNLQMSRVSGVKMRGGWSNPEHRQPHVDLDLHFWCTSRLPIFHVCLVPFAKQSQGCDQMDVCEIAHRGPRQQYFVPVDRPLLVAFVCGARAA